MRLTALQRILPRASARLRLTLVFALVVSLAGASIVTSVYLVMTYLPVYDITSGSTGEPARSGSGAAPLSGSTLPSVIRDPAAAGSVATTDVTGRITLSGPGQILGLLLTTSLVVFGVVLVAGVIVCWFVAGRVLRPVALITEAAHRASAGNLDHRIALGGPDDEFRRLASTFDAMLERLDRSFHAQRRFSANASHELRTPLATTQAILDVALLDPATVDAETLVPKLRETNTRNIETVEALLALADAQSGAMERERVDLDDVAREVVASCRADAEERGITVHSAILATHVVGDPTLVRLLTQNLVGNAVRYNRVDGDVWLTVADGRVRVENTGPVIDDDDVQRLTEPFFRASGRVTNSHGLGLALVDAIASGHGADLALDARPSGGLTVEVAFAR